MVHYVFEAFGGFSPSFPDRHFDCVFSVSTLEHIPYASRLDVLRDMNRCTAPGGRQLHTIDIPVPRPMRALAGTAVATVGGARALRRLVNDGVDAWIDLFRRSGVAVRARRPPMLELLDRRTLVESPDVVYRFYPPTGEPKPYEPAASLLVVIEDC
jgi:hypothetical protein